MSTLLLIVKFSLNQFKKKLNGKRSINQKNIIFWYILVQIELYRLETMDI